MTDGDDILKVPFDSSAWEAAIAERRDIGRHDAALFTPRRLLVDVQAAQDPEVDDVLTRSKASRSDAPQARTAARFGMVLYEVPAGADADERLVDAVRRIRAIVPNSASVDHLWLPGPNSVHGDDLPQPAPDPSDIPGAGDAGTSMTVAVLDTGVAVVPGTKDADVPYAVEFDALQDAEVPDEDLDDHRDPAAGHGTHVAGIVARTAPGARIVARRLLRTPVAMAGELDSLAAIHAAVDKGANVVSCSFGGPALFDAVPLATDRALAALAPHAVVVASAGNSATDRPCWPAASKRVVAVGAVGFDEKCGRWERADFSNYGAWVDCCAPGVDIASTFLRWKGAAPDPQFDGFATWSGTSFSAPHVSAAIAAHAGAKGIEPAQAVYELVEDPALPRIPGIGTLVA